VDYPTMLISGGIGKSAMPVRTVIHHHGPTGSVRSRDTTRLLPGIERRAEPRIFTFPDGSACPC